MLLDLTLPGIDGLRELDQNALSVFVSQLRRKLGDDAADPKLIVTHFGPGYRWIAGDTDPTGQVS